MSEITRVGVDLAKSVIQVNAVDAGGKLVTNRQLSRDKFLPWCAQLPVLMAAMRSFQAMCRRHVGNMAARLKWSEIQGRLEP